MKIEKIHNKRVPKNKKGEETDLKMSVQAVN
jgi:hypothetical protein